MTELLQRILQRGEGWAWDKDFVTQVCEEEAVTLSEFCNQTMVEVSREYLLGKIAFWDADRIANAVHNWILEDASRRGDGSTIGELAEPAWSLYCAFDAGEWDPQDGNGPFEEKTARLVKEILSAA